MSEKLKRQERQKIESILAFLASWRFQTFEDAARATAAHQLQLTIADLVTEVHDTHHPFAVSLYYKDQRTESERRAKVPFTEHGIFRHYPELDAVE